MVSKYSDRVYFVASRDIDKGNQIFYDYDTDPEALKAPGNSFLELPAKRRREREAEQEAERERLSKIVPPRRSARNQKTADTDPEITTTVNISFTVT